jgi:hypothetical protein
MVANRRAKPGIGEIVLPVFAKVTGKEQLTIPEAVLAEFPDIEHFRVTCENGRIVLTPLDGSAGDEIRKKMQARGITEQDVADAVAWARGR